MSAGNPTGPPAVLVTYHASPGGRSIPLPRRLSGPPWPTPAEVRSMPSSRAPLARAARALALFAALLPSVLSCNAKPRPLLPRSQTWAELRTIRRDVTVKPPEEGERPPYPRERLVDGEVVNVAPEGLAWLRRDGGATLLVRGSAALTLRSDAVEIGEGRVFVDTPAGVTTEIVTPGGPLHLAHVRASIDVSRDVTE